MNWIQYFTNIVRAVALKSKDSTQVGALAIGPAHNMLETGFNGIPRGVRDLPERMERPAKYLWTGHAEENLVAHAARSRLEGSTVFVTHFCCSRCCRLLINSGVKTIRFLPGQTSMDPQEFETARTMFQEAGVVCIEIEEYPLGI